MAVKPFQSTLIPYQDEIADLRSRRPPVSYARIAVILYEKYGLHIRRGAIAKFVKVRSGGRSEEHTSELQSRGHLVCRLLLEKKKKQERTKLVSYNVLNKSELSREATQQ